MSGTNADYLRYLCREYIRAVEQGLEGDYYRTEIHIMIEDSVVLSEEELKEILHNMDVHIGYMPPQGESSVEYWGDKLFEAIKAASLNKVSYLLRCEDTEEFLKRCNMSAEEWVVTWVENGMEVDGKMPVLERCEDD